VHTINYVHVEYTTVANPQLTDWLLLADIYPNVSDPDNYKSTWSTTTDADTVLACAKALNADGVESLWVTNTISIDRTSPVVKNFEHSFLNTVVISFLRILSIAWCGLHG
jgi:hypothetical protein